MFSLIAQHRAEKRILSCSCGQVTLGLVCSCWCSYNVLLRVSQTMSRSELDILLILQRSNTKKTRKYWNVKNWLPLFEIYTDSKQSAGKMFIKMQSKNKLTHNNEKVREFPLRLFLQFFLQ